MYDYTLRVCQIGSLTTEQTVQLGRLSRRGGLLSERLNNMLYYRKVGLKQNWHRFILAETKSGVILGWGLIFEALISKRKNGRNELMIYVNRSFRRNGIGTAIAKRATRIHEKSPIQKLVTKRRMHVFWVEDQGDFYKTVGLL